MNKKVILLFLSLITSCSTDIVNTRPEYINDKKSFSIKAEYSVQNTYLDYTGNWTPSSNIHQSTGTINNNDSNLSYSGTWTTVSNGSTTEGNYSYISSGAPIQIANDTSGSITYTRPGWLTYSSFKYNDIYNSNKYRVFNTETDIDKIKYIYETNTEAWSSNMTYWTTYNQGGVNYTYSDYSSAKVEIPFSGTNVHVYQYKGSDRGICNIKVYDENDNIVRDLDIDNYSATSSLSKTVINGLKNGNYKLLIQRTGNKNASSSGYIYDFTRIEVLPSIEYNFTGNNIRYNAFTANNCGKVAVTIDNNPNSTEIIDLYNSGNIYQNIYTKSNLGTGTHTITIDSLGEKHASSSDYRITLNEFNTKPAVRGEFSGTFLNLKLVGTPDSGKADLYIDGVLNQELDMYSSGSSFYSVNISGLTNTNHTFELVANNTKNTNSSGTRINFDGFTTNKATHTFTGTGIKYFANKNDTQGVVDLWLDGSKYGSYNLYSASSQSAQEIVNITGLSNTSHTIDLIPSGIKSGSSSGYAVNIDYLKVDNSGNQLGGKIE